MQVNRSGGGHEPEQRRTDEHTGGTADSLQELFAGSDVHSSRDTQDETVPGEYRFTHGRGFEVDTISDPTVTIPRTRIRRLTVSTVALILVTAIGFGYLSIQTGSSVAAFTAGLLAGLSGIVFGFGEIAGLLSPVGEC